MVGTTAWNPGTVNTGTSVVNTFAVSGAALGDDFEGSFNQDLQGCILDLNVQSAGNVTATITNLTGGNKTISNGTLRYRGMKGL